MVATAELSAKDVARRYGVSERWVRELARQTIPGHTRHERWTWRDWDDPDLAPLLQRLKNGKRTDDIREWDITLSTKNQITLPVAALKRLNVKAGDKLQAVVRGRSLVVLPHPISWVEYYAGVAEGLYGQTKEDIDAYLREVRGDWEPLD